ncbi:MAG: hypothetical protein M5U09_17675 [Gammaproteobacteria bacterium]|nr:hypothetical protein [Gammaproteobacteria bacterium]
MSRLRGVRVWAVAWTLGLAACGGEVAPGADSGQGAMDSGGDGSSTERCTADARCDDGVHCNGVETCDPSSSAADANGCVAGTPPCMAGQTCSEDERRCVSDDCTPPMDDADGDGVTSIDCGGSDCDDGDPQRFPGNAEICDPDDHDEDCDPTTFGVRDADGDGERTRIAATCRRRAIRSAAPTAMTPARV